MTIAKKTIVMVICVSVVLFALVNVISFYIFTKGFDDLERKTITQNTQQVTEALTVKIKALDSFCLDWAEWDDTYNFARDQNQDYINEYLMDDTFITGDFSLYLVTNTRGELVHGKLFDFNSMQETTLPADLPYFLSQIMSIVSLETTPGFRGVTILSGQPMLVSCRPILTSLKEGPSAGFLIVGRIVDNMVMKSISQTTYLSVKLLPVPSPAQETELQGVFEALSSTDNVYFEVEKGNVISGYDIIEDIAGKPAFIMKVSLPRDIHDQGIGAVLYLHISLLLIAIIFCLVFIFLIKNIVLNRLSKIGDAVNVIGSKSDVTKRIPVKGNDELSMLSNNINSMLDSFEKSEARRESQKEVIGNIIANTPNGVLALDDKNHTQLVNEAFRAMFGLGNRIIAEIKIDEIPELVEIANEINQFKESRLPSTKKELKYVRDGVNKIYIAAFARLKEEERYILYMTDISEEQSKQESLYLTDRLASIGEMASGIAHELNNPLTSIIGLSEIVMRDDVPDNVKEDLGLIKSESHRAAGIVRNLLSFARKNPTVKQQTNINKIILDVIKLRSYEHGVNNIKVVQELDPQLPDIMVDYAQIQQVCINIILNAEHAMVNMRGKGLLKIKTEVVRDFVKVSFTDDGPGIEPQNIRRIFDPFFTTKEVGKGTGLGLSISYGIITAHNGRIYAISEPGKGAVFVIELPLHNINTKETP